MSSIPKDIISYFISKDCLSKDAKELAYIMQFKPYVDALRDLGVTQENLEKFVLDTNRFKTLTTTISLVILKHLIKKTLDKDKLNYFFNFYFECNVRDYTLLLMQKYDVKNLLLFMDVVYQKKTICKCCPKTIVNIKNVLFKSYARQTPASIKMYKDETERLIKRLSEEDKKLYFADRIPNYLNFRKNPKVEEALRNTLHRYVKIGVPLDKNFRL